MKSSSGTVLRACLTPFIAELEDIFVNGFQTLFPYDSRKISMSLPLYNIGEPIILRAVLMNFTSDHLAQSEAGMLKAEVTLHVEDITFLLIGSKYWVRVKYPYMKTIENMFAFLHHVEQRSPYLKP